MPKKIKFESFKYRFLIAAESIENIENHEAKLSWKNFVNGLIFVYDGAGVFIKWDNPSRGEEFFSLDATRFYFRGDTVKHSDRQNELGLLNSEDPIKLDNDVVFKGVVMKVAKSAGYKENENLNSKHKDRIEYERRFHDDWASGEVIENIDVRQTNEVCTAPEMRCITQRLGSLKGKRLLDVGCGLGEASVYFALQGANVTSSDLSQGMLDATQKLAILNGVSVNLHLASAEDLHLSKDEKFDVIYAGNLLHHVDIEETIHRIKSHLADDGTFVSWDPLAYNPAINLYRRIATDVRTPDEHPLTYSDINIFRKNFKSVETHYFWFFTLIIFVIMALAQRRNPNKERFWKVILIEGNNWKWLYKPLEIIDKFILAIFPPFRLLCWNIVIFAKNK